MICPTCESVAEEFHNHHIVPKSAGGSDVSGNVIVICVKCHGLVHNINFMKHGERTKAGLAAARKQGKQLGRPKTISDLVINNAIQAVKNGSSIRLAAKQNGISDSYLSRLINRAYKKIHVPVDTDNTP